MKIVRDEYLDLAVTTLMAGHLRTVVLLARSAMKLRRLDIATVWDQPHRDVVRGLHGVDEEGGGLDEV